MDSTYLRVVSLRSRKDRRQRRDCGRAFSQLVTQVNTVITHLPRSRQHHDPRPWAVLVERCSLFKGLDAETLGALLRSARPCVAKRGEFFFLEGDPPRQVFVLVHGRVRLVRSDPQGRTLIVRLVSSAESFGLVAVWAGTVHRVAAQAAETSHAVAWDAATMAQLTRRHPGMAHASLRLMAERVEQGWSSLQDLNTRSIECRVARALLRLAHHTAPTATPEPAITVDLREQDLAELVGVTTFTISRILSAWKHRGLVDVGRAHIFVPDPRWLWLVAAASDARDIKGHHAVDHLAR